MNTPTLKTERLVLRKFTAEDIEALFLIQKDEEVNRFLFVKSGVNRFIALELGITDESFRYKKVLTNESVDGNMP